MALKRGKKPGGRKTGGRKPGVPNKVTSDLRNQINLFISKNWSKVQADFNKMEPKDKLLFLEKLLKYSVPTLSSVSASIDYAKMNEEDIDKIVERLIKSSENE